MIYTYREGDTENLSFWKGRVVLVHVFVRTRGRMISYIRDAINILRRIIVY